jgi:putative membrane protein
MNGMGWGGMWFGWIFGIVILVVIIWVIVTSISNSKNSQNYLPREDDALEILKKRYARGEISKEQFEQMKKDLNS